MEVKHSMDFDGIKLLVEKDRERFLEWAKKSKKLSLEELKNSYKDWVLHYNDVFEKYVDLSTGDTIKDISLNGAKLLYFLYLADYSFYSLREYNKKLEEEYNNLKKSYQTKTVNKIKKSKKSQPKKYTR